MASTTTRTHIKPPRYAVLEVVTSEEHGVSDSETPEDELITVDL